MRRGRLTRAVRRRPPPRRDDRRRRSRAARRRSTSTARSAAASPRTSRCGPAAFEVVVAMNKRWPAGPRRARGRRGTRASRCATAASRATATSCTATSSRSARPSSSAPPRRSRARRSRPATAPRSSSTATRSSPPSSRRSPPRKESVNLLTYVYWHGEIAREVADAVCERAQAGVEVNVLFDAVGSAKMGRELTGQMRDAGANLAIFRPPKPYADPPPEQPHAPQALHRRRARRPDRRRRHRRRVDRQRRRTPTTGATPTCASAGPVVRGLQGAFAENWLEATGDVLVGPDVPARPRADRGRLHDAARALVGGRRRHEHRGAVLPRDRLRARAT